MLSFGGRFTMTITPATSRQQAGLPQIRFGCLRVIPYVVRHLAGVQSDQPISEYLEGRKRPVCDCALQQQSVLVVGQELQALDLVVLRRCLAIGERSCERRSCLRRRTCRDRRGSVSRLKPQTKRALGPRSALSEPECASQRFH